MHLADIRPGEHFGEISLLTRRPRTASVRAVEDSIAIRLSREVVMAERDAALLASHLVEADAETVCHVVQQPHEPPPDETSLSLPSRPFPLRD